MAGRGYEGPFQPCVGVTLAQMMAGAQPTQVPPPRVRKGLFNAIEIVRERHAGNPALLEALNRIAAAKGYGQEDLENSLSVRKSRRTNKDEAYDRFSNRFTATNPIIPLHQFASDYRQLRQPVPISDAEIVNMYFAGLEARENQIFEAFRTSDEARSATIDENWAIRADTIALPYVPYAAPATVPAVPAVAAARQRMDLEGDMNDVDFGRSRNQPRRKRRSSKTHRASFGRTPKQSPRRKRRNSKNH